ncbi:MAG: cell division protein ZapA [Bacteroidetes bacterium]|nr:cell division protein ZapA [Bacteroidota bacterium]
MDVPLRVTIQQRDYGLRVKAGAETDTQALVRALDERISAFRHAFPMQPELTAVVMTALALAEEVQQARALVREAQAQLTEAPPAANDDGWAEALLDLDDALYDALYGDDELDDDG